jgi:hypothetical protein
MFTDVSGPIDCSETSVNNYQSRLRKTPEKLKPQMNSAYTILPERALNFRYLVADGFADYLDTVLIHVPKCHINMETQRLKGFKARQ